jgi:hypothetical protein
MEGIRAFTRENLMIARRICIALVLVAFTVALVPAQADALPSSAERMELGRTPFTALFSVLNWLRHSTVTLLTSFAPAHGATITGNGGA